MKPREGHLQRAPVAQHEVPAASALDTSTSMQPASWTDTPPSWKRPMQPSAEACRSPLVSARWAPMSWLGRFSAVKTPGHGLPRAPVRRGAGAGRFGIAGGGFEADVGELGSGLEDLARDGAVADASSARPWWLRRGSLGR